MVRVNVKHQVQNHRGRVKYMRAKAKTRNMTKTSKKGAYAKGKKKAFMIRRAPFIETKSKTTEDIVNQFGLVDHTVPQSFNSPTVFINPEVFTAWKQGLDEDEVVGRSCYVKYLKRKIRVTFPQPNITMTSGNPGVIPKIPQRYELIWGFVPNPLALTGSTTPTAPNCDMSYINGYINERVKDYLDGQKDFLRYIPKKASTLRIIGRRRVRPDLRFMSTAPPATMDPSFSSTYATGSIPDYTTSINWPMMRKLHLEKTDDLHGGNDGLFPNYAWLPFAVFVSWDWEDIPISERPQKVCLLSYNDIIYYSDS